MEPSSPQLSVTSYALLGQLALRPWSVYEMTKNVRRTLHWFWPRAESVLYGEVKALARRGLASVTAEPGRRGRPHMIYSITPEGESALRAWLDTRSNAGFSFHCEALLRVHLAPYGSREDLLSTLEVAANDAEQLLQQAITIGREFERRTHQFQEQVHVRAILFDYLWAFGLTMYAWAARSRERVEAWPDLAYNPEREEEAIAQVRELLNAAPLFRM